MKNLWIIPTFILTLLISDQLPAAIDEHWCNNGSPDPNCWTVEEYFYDSKDSALDACNLWVEQFYNVTECGERSGPLPDSLQAGFGQNLTSNDYWSGIFYYRTCPDGSIPNVEKGCPVIDEPRTCPVEAGNPVNTATGSKYHDETLITDSGHLNFSLQYSSQLRYDKYGQIVRSAVAQGWDHGFNWEVSTLKKEYDQEYVLLKGMGGRSIRYNKVGNGNLWQAGVYSGAELVETSGGWELTTEKMKILFQRPIGNSIGGKAIATEIHYYDGTVLMLTHNGSVVTNITDQFGHSLSFTYSVNNHVISHSDGRVWSLNYDSNNNLHQIVYPDNTVKTFYYEDPNHPYALTGISRRYDPSELDPNHPSNPVTEADMRFATYEYDTERRVIKEWHHAKDLQGSDILVEELDIVYNTDNTRTITNSRGKVSTYEVEQNNGLWQIKSITGPGCSSCSNDNTDFVYDNDGNLTSKTQDGVTTTYGGYDAKGQYAYKIEADGTADARRMDYTYDARFINKITSITEDSVYANNDKVTTYVYNDNGQMTSMTESGFKPDGTAINRTTTYEYNGQFNQISRIDGPKAGNTDETIFEYYDDKDQNANNHFRLKKVTGPENIVERENIQWSATGKVLSEDRPTGITITNTYEPLTDRLETVTQSDGTKSIVTKFTYLATGHVESVTRNFGIPEATAVTLSYDDALRVTRVTDQLGNYIEYTLDTEGNQEAEKTYDPNGVLKKQITQIFDDYDLVDSMTQSGVTVDYNYQSNGVLDNQVNGESITTDYSYDNLKRLTQISQDYQGTDPDTANTNTGFTYDAGERVKTVTDARGNVTTYNYDDFGNLITLVSPDTGTTTYSYDEAGNMLSKTDANGITATMSYDGRNRITSIDYPDNTLDTTYVYDQGVNGIGQLSSFSNGAGTTSMTYDAFGQLTGKTQGLLSQNLILGYNYDTLNRLQSMSYPSGLTLLYSYDSLGRIRSIAQQSFTPSGPDIDIVNQVSYLPFGPISSYHYTNGMNYIASYDDGYRLNNYSYSSVSQSGISAAHGYDNNHNITSITREVPTYNQSYGYDALDRLTDDGDIDFGYDKLGNRTSEQTVGQSVIDYIYETNSNRLTQVDSLNPTRSYDNNGNTLSINEGSLQTFAYNQANRMRSHTQGFAITEYQHNAIGQRIIKWQQQGINDYIGTAFLYDELGQLINETSFRYKQSTVTIYSMRETIWLGNKPVAQLLSVPYKKVWNRTWYYIMTDHLNTPRWVTDHNGVMLWRWESDAFGTTVPDEDVDGDGTDLEFNLRFPGQYYDEESGMHYNYFRDYEPGTGRYLESDPIGLGGGWNTFGYVKSNPIINSDHFGLLTLNHALNLELCALFPSFCEPEPEPDPEPNPYLNFTNLDIKCYLKCRKSSVSVCSFLAVGFGSLCYVNPSAKGVGVFTGRTVHPKCAQAGFVTCNLLYHKVCAPKCQKCED